MFVKRGTVCVIFVFLTTGCQCKDYSNVRDDDDNSEFYKGQRSLWQTFKDAACVSLLEVKMHGMLLKPFYTKNNNKSKQKNK